MTKIAESIKMNYNIFANNIIPLFGGLSAMAYKVNTDNKMYFLKAYKNGTLPESTFGANIDIYMPALMLLNNYAPLFGKIIRPHKTVNGDYCVKDYDCTYLLFDYINGEAIGARELTINEVKELSLLLAHLHKSAETIAFDKSKITEDFSLGFCDELMHYFINDCAAIHDDVAVILNKYKDEIIEKINAISKLSVKIKSQQNTMVLCHTDAHGFNIMQDNHLILVDFEGMKYAPAEADLFMFANKPYWNIFLENYNMIRPEYRLCEDLILFYTMRRKLEDICAFTKSILSDDLSVEQRFQLVSLLKNECINMNKYFSLS